MLDWRYERSWLLCHSTKQCNPAESACRCFPPQSFPVPRSLRRGGALYSPYSSYFLDPPLLMATFAHHALEHPLTSPRPPFVLGAKLTNVIPKSSRGLRLGRVQGGRRAPQFNHTNRYVVCSSCAKPGCRPSHLRTFHSRNPLCLKNTKDRSAVSLLPHANNRTLRDLLCKVRYLPSSCSHPPLTTPR